MENLESLKDCHSKKHLGRIIPNLQLRDDSPTIYFKFQDQSIIEFEFCTGRQIPRAYGNRMALEFKNDLEYIESTKDICTFFFKDNSKIEIDINQFPCEWTKFPRNIGRIPRMIITTEESWYSYAIFNRNAFGANVAKIVDGCTEKSAMLFAHIRTIKYASEAEKQKFVDIINGKLGKSPIEGFQGNEIQLEYDSVLLTIAVHGFLTSLKTLLDNYAFLLACTIGLKSVGDFGKAKVNGKKISGGSIINALRNNCPKSYSSGKDLADIIEKHSNNWISNVVSIRDQAAHHTSISSYDKICLIAKRNINTNLFNIQFLPITIKDIELHIYFNEILKNLKTFLEETIEHIPGLIKSEINIDMYGEPFIQ